MNHVNLQKPGNVGFYSDLFYFRYKYSAWVPQNVQVMAIYSIYTLLIIGYTVLNVFNCMVSKHVPKFQLV